MRAEYLQNLRYKLQKRVRRVNSTEYPLHHYALKQLWGFILSYPIFVGILEDLARRCASMEAEADKIVDGRQQVMHEKELEVVGTAYFVIKKCIEKSTQNTELLVGQLYRSGTTGSGAPIEAFNEIFLEPLYEYLDEQIDDQRAICALLMRYKHKCEWFRRDYLFDLWEKNSQSGEKNLALDMYEYLYDQGIDFFIEPTSVSGKVDLIEAQSKEAPLILDAKVFTVAKGKGYIVGGFNQIYTYTLDYDEPFGYLVVYKTCDEDLKFTLSHQTQSTPFVVHNGKTIFIVTIDISKHSKSASKRGVLKTIEIAEEDLIRPVGEVANAEDEGSSDALLDK